MGGDRCTRAALVLLALSAPASLAHGIPRPPAGVPRAVNIDVPLLVDGTLIFVYDSGSLPLDPATIEVHDESGAVVDGVIEAPALDDQPLQTVWPGLWLWRPSVSLAFGAKYAMTATNSDTSESARLDFETVLSDPPRAIEPEWIAVELAAHPADRGEPRECCERDDGQPPTCFSPDLVLEPKLVVAVDLEDPSPVLRQLLFHVEAVGAEGTTHEHAWSDRTHPLPPVHFLEQHEQYCARVTVYDAVTRAAPLSFERCVPHRAELFEGVVPKEDYEIEGSLGAGGCHRPPDGYEALWCTANDGRCFYRDTHGCQHFAELCPEFPREPEMMAPAPFDAGVQQTPKANKEPAESRGCAAAPARRESPWPCIALLLLAVRSRARFAN